MRQISLYIQAISPMRVWSFTVHCDDYKQMMTRYRTVLHPFSTQAASLTTTAAIILCINLFAVIITLP